MTPIHATRFATLLAAAALFCAPHAHAQQAPDPAPAEGEAADVPPEPMAEPESGSMPIAHDARSLNLPASTIRGGGTLRVYRDPNAFGGGDYATSLMLGGAIGITDGIEIGIDGHRLGMRHPVIAPTPVPQGTIAFSLSPDFEWGDAGLYGRFHLAGNETHTLDIAADVGFLLPIQSDFQAYLAIVVRSHPWEKWTFDTGMQLTIRNADNVAFDTWLPISAIFQAHEQFFIVARSGVNWIDFDEILLPLGLEFGYTVASGGRPYMDVTVGLAFPALFVPTNDNDAVWSHIWQVAIGARVFLPI